MALTLREVSIVVAFALFCSIKRKTRTSYPCVSQSRKIKDTTREPRVSRRMSLTVDHRLAAALRETPWSPKHLAFCTWGRGGCTLKVGAGLELTLGKVPPCGALFVQVVKWRQSHLTLTTAHAGGGFAG